MTNLDDKILDAIKSETEQSLADYSKELGIFGLIGESFRGALRGTVVIAILLILIFAAITVYCAVQLYGTDDIAMKLNWLAAGFGAFIVFALTRLWFFMELNRLSIRREIKRVELQVSLLAEKLNRLT